MRANWRETNGEVELARAERAQVLTETEHGVEEYDQHHCHDVDEIPGAAHPERTFGHMTPACKHVR